jgi:hypothetical protein
MSKHDADILHTTYANSGLRWFNDFHSAHRRNPAKHDLGGDRFTVADLLGVIAGEETDSTTWAEIRDIQTGLMDAQFQAARNRHPAGKGLIAA